MLDKPTDQLFVIRDHHCKTVSTA